MKTEYKKIKDSIYKYQRSKKWLLAKIYSNQINNWKRKRWEIPSYTLSELRDKYIESIAVMFVWGVIFVFPAVHAQ